MMSDVLAAYPVQIQDDGKSRERKKSYLPSKGEYTFFTTEEMIDLSGKEVIEQGYYQCDYSNNENKDSGTGMAADEGFNHLPPPFRLWL